MVPALAFAATAISTLFAQATLVRYTRGRQPHQLAWTVALAMFALASIALALGVTTGWDDGTFRVFYLFGAILNVPWLALGTVYLLFGSAAGRRCQWALVLVSGLAAGVLISAPMTGVVGSADIPVGKEVFGVLPRVLAVIGSGVGATVIFAGALFSAVQFARRRSVGDGRRAGANALIATGTLVLSSGGLIQGAVGHDEAFAASLTVGVSIIYVGFLVSSSESASASEASSRRSSLPSRLRGNSSTSSKVVGTL